MAQMILQQVGAAFGGPVGAWLGRTLGGAIDNSVINGLTPAQAKGPRLAGLQMGSTAEGAPMAAVYGKVRVGGQVIWAARFTERRAAQASAGGKGGPSSARSYRYAYSLSFAVGLCEGPIDSIGRIWADGKLMDTAKVTLRLYHGDAAQTPDPLISAIEADAPAYRGLAYLVFEDLALDLWGNRAPAISVEVFRRARWTGGPPALEDQLKSVCLIPGAGEAVYATTPVVRQDGYAATSLENQNSAMGRTDLTVSLDQLQSQLPNVSSVNLVSAWFGDDLRAGSCRIRPGVESADKATTPAWSAGGVDRAGAYLVSRSGGGPAYGGTPSDLSLIAAMGELKRRGLAVTLYPFVLMDIPPGNGRADPYGGKEQAPYPWRGRITVSPDKSAAVTASVSAFFGTAKASDFVVSAGQVRFRGTDGWSYRRMVLHHAALAAAAQGVTRFLIGSELRGLTTLRSDKGDYPAVAQLRALAAECRTLLGPSVEIGYSADWSEYFGHQPGDGSGDVFYHLDPLWADPNINFVGVDWYPPVSDWRDGSTHADAKAGYSGPSDPAYLSARIAGGEGFDWYYASPADRDAQRRTLITDGRYNEPWVFRPKDLVSWWSNPHHDRPAGVRKATTTAWVPKMKPIRLIEFGCPAVDKGANSPNLFIDAKSAESALPPYSNGCRDDLGQRRFIEALLAHFSDPAFNPASDVYAGRMIPADGASLWCWDARPFPDFPARTTIWADGPNWALGHWLNGRAGAAPVAAVAAALAARAGLDPAALDLSGASGLVQGYGAIGPSRLIDALSELGEAFGFDLAERGGRAALIARDRPVARVLGPEDLALVSPDGSAVRLSRGLKPAPDTIRLRYSDAYRDYQMGQTLARAETVEAGGAEALDLPLVLAPEEAVQIGRRRLRRIRAERDTASVSLAALIAHQLEPGDAVQLPGSALNWRVARVSLDGQPTAALVAMESPDAPQTTLPRFAAPALAQPAGPPALALMDLPPLPGAEDDARPVVAAFSQPWSPVILSAGPSLDALTERASLTAPSAMGLTVTALAAGPRHRLDMGNGVEVQLKGAALASVTLPSLLSGANACAVLCANGEWELMQFLTATLTAPDRWRLSGLLRAQGGTEGAMASGAAVGASFVLLSGDLARADLSQSERGLMLDWRAEGGGRTDFSGRWMGLALRPFSPCHLSAQARPGGDLLLSWVRRARQHGDSLDDEPPLGEQAELYQVQILRSDGAVARTLTSQATQLVYSAALQGVDFPGGPVAGARFKVQQNSAIFGWGAASVASLWH
jgi:hypothetical protein